MIVTALVLAAAAIAIGALNSFVTGLLRVNPIVATIATMGIVQGLAIIIRPQPAGLVASAFRDTFGTSIGFVPVPFIILVVLSIAAEIWLYRGRGGLALRAAGFAPDATNRVGTRVVVVQSLALVVCAAVAVVAGVCLMALTGIGSNALGAGYTLQCFAAVFIGGAVLSGGRGSFVGAVLGALFLSLVNNVTPLLGIPDGSKQLVYGGILLVAVSMYAANEQLRSR